MKTVAALYLVSLALSARPLFAAPVGSPGHPGASPNPAHGLKKRYWSLNCTDSDVGDVTRQCLDNDTFCDGRCDWVDQCDFFTGCKVAVQPGGKTGDTGETGETGEGEGPGDDKKGLETAEPTKTPGTK